MSTFTVNQLVKGKYTLDAVEWFYHRGVIDRATYDGYCHAWQTGAPRFAVQACRCAECMKTPVWEVDHVV